MMLLDNTDLTPEEAAEIADRWILKKIKALDKR